MNEKPRWTGKVLDANGRVGRVQMDIAQEGGPGVFKVELQERDGPAAAFSGEVSLIPEGSRMRLKSSATADKRGEKIEWEANLARAEAGRYALAAMLGTYDAGGGTDRPLTKGVVILWQFA